jgi:hypothetical protein
VRQWSRQQRSGSGSLKPIALESGASTEREIIMLRFHQKTRIKDINFSRPASGFTRARQGRVLGVLCGSVAFIALTSATPIMPASAQSAPAGLLRLEPSQPWNEGGQIVEDRRANARGAYARMSDEDAGAARSSCMQRFRSYDPGSGTYLGYDGHRHPCP